MENVYICDAKFLDGRTIQLSENFPVSLREIQLLIIPKKKIRKKSRTSEGKDKNVERF